jgi:putative transposase
LLDGKKMAALCREFDVSRKTAYKIFQRYRDCGLEGLTDAVESPSGNHSDLPTPTISTAHAVLDRHGLVSRGRKRRYKAQGTTLSKPLLPNDLRCAG